jgi:ribose-phosphate pyrophosphokinase
MPTLFSFAEYSHIGRFLCDLPGIKLGQFSITRYQNQELHAAIHSPVGAEHCLIVAGISPPEEQLVSLLLLAHTLRKEGARRITALLPYLAYSREDKVKPGESLATAWVGAMLRASAIDEIWTVDLHSEHGKQLLTLPLESLSPASIFGACLRKQELTDASFIAPDEGAIARCQAVKSASGNTAAEIVYFQKRRTASGIEHHDPIGRVGRRAVIVDDVLDTGATLVSACEKLVNAGAAELHICVTHGLFAGTRWHDLWSLPVKHIFCTDTVPACSALEDPRITTLPVGPLLRTKVASIL